MNLVTGATGLLGSHIVEQLICRSRPVRALVRAGSDTRWLARQGAELVEGDITDPASLERAFEGVQNVYHAAARVGDWGPWHEFVEITINGTANMLAAAKKAGVRRFVHISSISAYGHPDGKGLVLDETAPLGTNLHRWSYYSRAKVEAEKLVWAASEAGLPVTVIRPSWLYGPRDRATIGRVVRLIRTGRSKILGSGENRMNLAYAGNVAEGCILAADSEMAIGQAYNCSNDGPITQKEYFDRIAAELGHEPIKRHVPYKVAYGVAFMLECIGHLFGQKRPPMVTRYAVWLTGRRCFFETQKIRDQLGWSPTVLYDQGIPTTIKWYLSQSDGSGKADLTR